jgi:CheY-like chemotaxis protein
VTAFRQLQDFSERGNGIPMPKKILVVEDNLDTRELIHLHLTTEGFIVVTASDGHEGLYLASAEHPDLIITDISMPELDGLELVRQLRGQPEFAALPILVLTAFGESHLTEAIRVGASRALSKPVLFDGLIDEVREMLAESENK